MAIKRPPIIKDAPFVQQSGLTGRWYFVASYRQISADTREAHVKHDITDAIEQITAAHDADIRRDQAEKDAGIAQRRIDVGYAGHPIITAEFPDNGQQIASAIRAQFTPSPETSENGDN